MLFALISSLVRTPSRTILTCRAIDHMYQNYLTHRNGTSDEFQLEGTWCHTWVKEHCRQSKGAGLTFLLLSCSFKKVSTVGVAACGFKKIRAVFSEGFPPCWICGAIGSGSRDSLTSATVLAGGGGFTDVSRAGAATELDPHPILFNSSLQPKVKAKRVPKSVCLSICTRQFMVS